MGTKLRNGDYIEWDKNKLDRENNEKSKNEITLKWLITIGSFLVGIYIFLSQALSQYDIYFKDEISSIVTLIFIGLVSLIGFIVIYKALTNGEKSQKSIVTLATVSILGITVVSGIAGDLTKIIKKTGSITYGGVDYTIGFNNNENFASLYKERSVFLMERVISEEVSNYFMQNTENTDENKLEQSTQILTEATKEEFLESSGFDLRFFADIIPRLTREVMAEKFGEVRAIRPWYFEYEENLTAEFYDNVNDDINELKAMTIKTSIATYDGIPIVGSNIDEFKKEVKENYERVYFSKENGEYILREKVEGRPLDRLKLNLVVDENNIITEIKYGNFEMM